MKKHCKKLQDPTMNALDKYSPEQLSKYVSHVEQYIKPNNVHEIDVKKLQDGKYSYREVQQLLKTHFPSKPCQLTKKKVELEQDLLYIISLINKTITPNRSNIPVTSSYDVNEYHDVESKDTLVNVINSVNKHKHILAIMSSCC